MADGALILQLLPEAKAILDIGSGPDGSPWWPSVHSQSTVVAIDKLWRPKSLPLNFTFYKMAAEKLIKEKKWFNSFDLIVAHHLFEHVDNPVTVAQGCYALAKPGAKVHVGIPDASLFTDRFYRLIHYEGGGHIQQLTLDSMKKIMEDAGFKTVLHEPWADNWGWLKKCFEYKIRKIRYITQAEIDYIADVFIKELTPDKGYLYGWEIIFQKQQPQISTDIH